MKLKCNKCNSPIYDISILHKDVMYREDVIIKNGKMISDGDEYFQDIISRISYNCKNCGEVVDNFNDGEKPMVIRKYVQLDSKEVEKNLKITED